MSSDMWFEVYMLSIMDQIHVCDSRMCVKSKVISVYVNKCFWASDKKFQRIRIFIPLFSEHFQ